MKIFIAIGILCLFCNITTAITLSTTPEMNPSSKNMFKYKIPIYENDYYDKEIGSIEEGEEVDIIGRDRGASSYKIKNYKGEVGYIRGYDLEDNYKKDLDRAVAIAIADEKAPEIKKLNLSPKSCPIKLLDVYITYNSIDIPQVNIEYINKSKKIITAFSMMVYCYNVYGEPTGMFGDNVFGGISSDENLKPNDINTGTWTLNTHELTKKVKIKVYKIQFSDGTKWMG